MDLKYLANLGFLMFASSCVLPKDQGFDPLSSLPPSFEGSGVKAQSIRLQAKSQWWKLLNIAELNDFIAAILSEHLAVRQAQSRLSQKIALAAAADAKLWPTLNAQISASRSAQRSLALGINDTIISNLFSSELALEYSMGIWGEEIKKRSGAEIEVQKGFEELGAVQADIAKELTVLYIRYKASLELLELSQATKRWAASYKKTLSARFGANLASAEDFHQSHERLHQTEAEIWQSRITLQKLRAEIRSHTRGSYIPIVSEKRRLSTIIPPLIDNEIPSRLVRRNPRLRASLLGIARQNKELAAAVAAQFPRLTLGIEGGKSTREFSELLRPDDLVWRLLANLTVPLWDGGRRRAEVHYQKSLLEESILAYQEQLWLQVTEVERLSSLQASLQAKLWAHTEQLEANKRAVQAVHRLFMQGKASYSQLLLLIERQYNINSGLIRTRSELIEAFVLLAHTLGGWQSLEASKPKKG